MDRRLVPSQYRRFQRDRSGMADPQTALLIAGISLAVAVLAAPMLQGAADSYAQNRGFGIDRVLTGAVGTSHRVTVRQSVLSENPTVLCSSGSAQLCAKR
jgi:hypothetical protein